MYTGSNVTSSPRSIMAEAKALSRKQLPQIVPPAPAVMYAIRILRRPPRIKGKRTENGGSRGSAYQVDKRGILKESALKAGPKEEL